MIEPKPIVSRAKIWRLGKDGYELATALLVEYKTGSILTYDSKYALPDKDYRAKCDVCVAREQGYACDRIVDSPGPYEFEGGCMDCKYRCGKPPIHIGVRNYCKEHMYIMNAKLGVSNDTSTKS